MVNDQMKIENCKMIYNDIINNKTVIPAPYQVRDKFQPESRKTLDSGSSPE